MTNRIYTNEKTCPLCHKNKAMFTLSLEGEKIQVCPTCYRCSSGTRNAPFESFICSWTEN